MTENSQLSSFIQQIGSTSLPVLSKTLESLTELFKNQYFNYHHLDQILHFDPACMINLLSYANQEITIELDKEISQVEHAAMLLGTDRIQGLFTKMPAIDSLKDKAIAGKLEKLQNRGLHTAFQAENFAKMINADWNYNSYTGALITPIAELICWQHEPIKAQKVELLVYNEGMPLDEAQTEIFGFSYYELAEQITSQWKLPQQYIQSQDVEILEEASKVSKCIFLAQRCSFLAEQGWYYEKMYEHITLCSKNLYFSEGRIAKELHTTAAQMAQQTESIFNKQAIPGYLALLPGEVPYTPVLDLTPKTDDVPQQSRPKAAERTSVPSINLINTALDFPSLVRITMNALYETKFYSRVVFLMFSKDKQFLVIRSLRGTKDPEFTEAKLPMDSANIFSNLLKKPQSVFVNHQNRQKFRPLINHHIENMFQVHEFMAKSVFAKNKPIGLFYMDNHPLKHGDKEKEISLEAYTEMKRICAMYDRQFQKIS